MTETISLETLEKEFSALETQYNDMSARLKALEAGEPEKEKDESYILDTSLMYMAGDLNNLHGGIKRARGYRYEKVQLSPQEIETLKKEGKVIITLYTSAEIEQIKKGITEAQEAERIQGRWKGQVVEELHELFDYAKAHEVNINAGITREVETAYSLF